jgi:hypothetical protein
MIRDDPRLVQARAVSMAELSDRLALAGLKRLGHELVGPCPRCGGRDRFAINLRSGVWLCRRCDAGGDQIALVRHVLGSDFAGALEWLCGPKVELPEPVRRARIEAAERHRAEQDAIAAQRRAEARVAALALWRECVAAEGTMVRAYLARRGIAAEALPEIPPVIRFHGALRYVVGQGRGAREVHRGPAMVCAISGPDGRVIGVHRTWIDPVQPKGKARIRDGEAELVAKKVLGSKKGGTIRLTGRRIAPQMIMGEGVETSLTAMIAAPEAMVWAGVDLGNMSGRRRQGKGLRFAGLPDLDDREAFVPPEGVAELVYLLDGDSDPRTTRAACEAGLRRAMLIRRGLRGRIVNPGSGRDLNDLLMEV